MKLIRVNWESFWDRVEIIPFHDCWEWVGAKFPTGYGKFHSNLIDGRRLNYLAHRLSVVYHGTKLEPDLVIDHTCRNRGCVRPEHLRQITRGRNILENSVSPSALNLAKTHCPKGHQYSGHKKNKSRHVAARKCHICDAETSERYRGSRIKRQSCAPPSLDANAKCKYGHQKEVITYKSTGTMLICFECKRAAMRRWTEKIKCKKSPE